MSTVWRNKENGLYLKIDSKSTHVGFTEVIQETSVLREASILSYPSRDIRRSGKYEPVEVIISRSICIKGEVNNTSQPTTSHFCSNSSCR